MELIYEKNKRFIILILFFLIFIILFLLHGVIINKEKREQVVKIGFYDDYPHFYIDHRGNVCGYYKDITEKLAEKLNFKIEKLNNFIEKNDIFKTIDLEEQELLKEQREIMNKYANILRKRIK